MIVRAAQPVNILDGYFVFQIDERTSRNIVRHIGSFPYRENYEIFISNVQHIELNRTRRRGGKMRVNALVAV